ncbi:MFS transporter [Aquirufa sp.]|jgi:MFS family permease|uniref:MFS transporter n=1 Tax=Aquirufa sp. TaxID=2676249 RepID=UPI0037BF60C6
MFKTRFGIGILFFLCGINFATWATRIPDFKKLLNLTEAELGTVLMGLPIGSLVSLPLAGWLIAKYNSKIICLIAVCMYICIVPLIGYSSTAFQLFGVLFLFGMSGDILNIAMNTQVIALENKLSKIFMSSFHAIFSIGLMLGALLGSLMITMNLGYKIHFWGIAFLNLVLIPSFYYSLLPDEKSINYSNEKLDTSIFNLNSYLITLALIAFCGMLCEGAMADWITLYFEEIISSNIIPQTIGFTTFAAAMVLGRLLGDFLSNKYKVKNVLIINGFLIAVGMSITLVSYDILIKICGCFLVGIGVSTIVPIIYSQAGMQTKIKPAIAIAGVSTIAYIGFLIGPVIIGYFADISSLKYSLILLIVLGLLSSLIATIFLPDSEN